MRAIKQLLAGLTLLTLLAGSAWAAEWVEGEVRRVDATNGKLTIKHGEIKELKMPPMTMVFILKDAELAKQFKPGQKVRFQATDLGGGKMQLEAIEAAK